MPRTDPKPDVLLITQSQQTGRSISKLLQTDFSVGVVEDAEYAWERLLENHAISVLICELSLAMDDFNLLERVRNANDNRIAAIPVLLLVGESDKDERRDSALQMGASDIINMPFISSELITRVRLHAQLFIQHNSDQLINTQAVTAANVLQQLSQENIFRARLQQELSFSYRHKSFVSACQLKLDNLKTIASGYDKNTLNSIVQVVATSMQQSIRCEDTLCYLGKAEFCILYPATNGIGAAVGIKRIKQKIATRPVQIDGKKIPISLSAAIYTDIADQNTNADSVIKVLQQRLGEAIAKGGNCIVSSSHTGASTQVSVDRALKLIEHEQTETLSLQAHELMLAILPLLEFCDEVLDLGLKSPNQSLRRKLYGKNTEN